MVALSGGAKLEAALRDLASKLNKAGTLRVGFLEGALYPRKPTAQLRQAYAKRKAKGKTGAIKGSVGTINVPTVAFFQEYGTGRIPPRPFFRTMIANKSHEWGPAIANLLITTNYDTQKTLMLAGEGIAGQLRQSIIETNAPPLAASTIARKGFDKPLIDTSHMINSVSYDVVIQGAKTK